MSAGPRSIAVVLDGPPTPAWQARALAGLDASPGLHVAEVRLAGRPRRGRLRALLAALDRRVFRLGADALAPVTLAPRPLAGPAAGLVLWLAERPAPSAEPGELLELRHDGRAEPADDAFARAVLRGAACVATAAVLRRSEGAVVVERTVSGVRAFSATLGRDLALWKLAALVCRAAERAPGLETPAPDPASAAQAPSTAALAARAALAWPRALTTRLLFKRPWSIRVRARGAAPTGGWAQGEQLVRWRPGHLYADPFLIEHEGRHHLFCEEVPAGARRARISHTELRLDGGVAEPPAPVLEAPHHLSYPFVFAHGGQLFMIPETSAANRVELYRAVDFPRAWEREAVLLEDLDAADTTLLEHDGRLWLFAAVAAPGASSLDELHLFWADELRGPWRPHPRNPVVSDVRCARPAGAVQRWDGRLVRPGQDGSRRYGWAISFREIDVLSTTAYAEHERSRLEPGDLGDARATHAYASDGRFEAVDLRQRAPRVRLRGSRR